MVVSRSTFAALVLCGISFYTLSAMAIEDQQEGAPVAVPAKSPAGSASGKHPPGTVQDIAPELIKAICNSNDQVLLNWMGDQRSHERDGVNPCTDPNAAKKTKDSIAEILNERLAGRHSRGTVPRDVQDHILGLAAQLK